MNLKWLRSYQFLLCLGISVLLWYLVYLASPVNLDVNINVDVTGIPDDYVVTKINPEKINVKFDVKGSRVNGIHSAFKKSEIQINIADKIKATGEVLHVSVQPANSVRNFVAEMIKTTTDFSVETDSINIVLEKVKSKKVPLTDEFVYKINPMYMKLPSSGFSTDSILIKGVESEVDKITSVTFPPTNFGMVSKSMEKQYVVKDYYNNVVTDPEIVSYKIDVTKFTSSDIRINLEDIFHDENYAFFPDHVDVFYNVITDRYDDVNEESFKLKAEFPKGKQNVALITIDSVPNYIEVLYINPKEVEYLIFK